MPQITINGRACSFEKGESILQVALRNGLEIPHYCWHPALSVVASCRICLAEVWAPNPRNDNRLEPIPKLLPTCQTPCGEGQVVYTDSPKSIANQKAVMEYLLINHPVDCPVCDQAGECYLQDYSYQFGRGASRFEEQKNKQPKKDLGPHVLLYADRCIMCTRCVRFCREVTGTSEITIEGRGSTEQIDVFPGVALDNELSANVVDLCPVGALLDKDFLFQQRVWFLEKTPSIDGITASGDSISVEHANGQVYRIKPRENPLVNRWWISDEIRYGWKFIHDERRLRLPRVRGEAPYDAAEAPLAYEAAYQRAAELLGAGRGRVAALLSPMLSCEDAFLLSTMLRGFAADAKLGLGPVPRVGADKTFPGGYVLRAEKAPNARGVRRVLAAIARGEVPAFDEFLRSLDGVETVLVTGNYPSDWVLPALAEALRGRRIVLIDTLPTALVEMAEVVLPGATWVEKAGSFENAEGRLQGFDRAIAPLDFAKSEAQIALDLVAVREAGEATTPDRLGAAAYDAGATRRRIVEELGLGAFVEEIAVPSRPEGVAPDMELVDL
ncbi:MAG TPA: 2Fe-2S iron-sulfur cluster-binding protein [Phycisphaerales bacterium]|nr:2Fe-2S iron-sulfur cluster-binding protein [Phycisphaerales bacterium]HMP38167.1 2Fe-2S iron-sulfur cluster-binding protein [Phycisphaerales bacterium]